MVKTSHSGLSMKRKSVRKSNYYKKQSRILSRKTISRRLTKNRFGKLRKVKSRSRKLKSRSRKLELTPKKSA